MDPQELLTCRKVLLDSLQGDFVVKDLGSGKYALQSKEAQTDVTQVDRGRMAVPCTISTQCEDRARDIVVTRGISTDSHRANPVVLYNHGLSALSFPIGKAESPEGRYAVEIHDGLARSTTYFSQKNLEAEQVFQLVEEGILRGVSIGFVLKQAEYRKDGRGDDSFPGLLISKCEMFEYSHVPVPQNPEALADKVGKGVLAGRPISGALLKSFVPYLPPAKEITISGFQGAETEKTMKDDTAPAPEPLVAKLKAGGMSETTLADGAAATDDDADDCVKSKLARLMEDDPDRDRDEAMAKARKMCSDEKAKAEDYGDKEKDEDEEKEAPNGAKALRDLHDWLMGTLDCAVRWAAKQENPRTADKIEQAVALLGPFSYDLRAFWMAEYPELKALYDGPEDEDPADTRRPLGPRERSETSAWAARMRAVRKAKEQYTKLLRHDGANSGTEELAALREEVAVLRAVNTELRAGLKEACTNHQNLIQAFRRAKAGR